ncbi:MAG TPA: PQQ-dependent sugar dehydrogenase [Blastocatellia bacterium]|jgi:glucose/arabinose dehydrogenase|nr:PQQ-dependent sugar dehydrogenase [Blastocatellia bacterium]
MREKLFSILICLLTFCAGCGSPPPGRGEGETGAARGENGQTVQFRIETVTSNLEVPWAIAFAPDGRIFVTERPGRVRVIEQGKLRPEPVTTIREVSSAGESGLMDLTLHPQFASNHYLYLAYAYPYANPGDGQRVRVMRFREAEGALVDPLVIIENIPAARFHAGTRTRFGPDGKLYITTGDATQRELAQRLDSLAGKTLRLNDDGGVPPDNPFVGQPNARPEIWSYGHRNSQGIAWQPGGGAQFQTEHGPSGFDGPRGGDEVNIVERGGNYGWPVIHHTQTEDGMFAPLLEYTPAVAPASALFYHGAAFPQFRGDFFFGNLRGECLIRVKLDGSHVVSQERLLQGRYGRIREVAEGPDGAIYFSTSNRDGRGKPAANDDRILRIVPAKGANE